MIDVDIAESQDELVRYEAGHLSYEVEHQSVGSDIERHPQEHVTATLEHVQGELAVGHEELVDDVAGRQSHLIQLPGVPGCDDQTAVIGIFFDFLNYLGDLIHGGAVRFAPGSPLDAVDATEVTIEFGFGFPIISVGIGCPDFAAKFPENIVVAVAGHEPEEFRGYTAESQLLGGGGGESVSHAET